jgi:hypothetical protein
MVFARDRVMCSHIHSPLLIDRIYLFETYKSHKSVLTLYHFSHNYPIKNPILKASDI